MAFGTISKGEKEFMKTTMKRRTYLGAMLAGAAAAAGVAEGAEQRPIQLHCELAVDPKKEQECIDALVKHFRPIAKKHAGYIDLKLVKLRQVIEGPKPVGNFRFVLTFQSEELRQKWIASADHAKFWPGIENTLTDKKFGILLYDVY